MQNKQELYNAVKFYYDKLPKVVKDNWDYALSITAGVAFSDWDGQIFGEYGRYIAVLGGLGSVVASKLEHSVDAQSGRFFRNIFAGLAGSFGFDRPAHEFYLISLGAEWLRRSSRKDNYSSSSDPNQLSLDHLLGPQTDNKIKK